MTSPRPFVSRAARALWAIRWKFGELLGWDGPDTGLDSRMPTLHDRLPTDLREALGPDFAALPFTPLYLINDEFAAEIATNRTMHAVRSSARKRVRRPRRYSRAC